MSAWIVTTGSSNASTFLCPDCDGYGGRWAWDDSQPPDPSDVEIIAELRAEGDDYTPPNVYEMCARCWGTGDIASEYAAAVGGTEA